MRNPPPTSMRKPRSVSTPCQLNSCRGTSPEKSWISSVASDACAAGVMATGWAFASRMPPTNPPATTPTRKARFHTPVRQSYLKYATLPGTNAAHRCRRLLETPNCLLPIASRPTATRPSSGPVTYHGQGRCNSAVIGPRSSFCAPWRRDRPEQQILVVEAEVRERRHGRHLEPIDGPVRREREGHVRVLEVLRAPARDERVVVPVLEIAHERGRAAEPEDEPAVLECHAGVAIQLVAVRARVPGER